MNQSIIGILGLSIAFIQASIITAYSYSKKVWLETFSIFEMIIVSQVVMSLFCIFLYFFVINRNSFHNKLKSIFLSKSKGNIYKCINLILMGIAIPVIVYISGYLNKHFNLSNLFVVKTSLLFILFQLMNYFYVGERMEMKQWISIFFFVLSLLFAIKI